MSSTLSARLAIDVSGYEKGISEAKQSTEQYKTQLGDLSKSFPSMRKELVQTKKAIQDMENAWRSMSDAQKKSFEGQQLYKQLTQLKARGADLVDTLGDINAELRNMASDTKALDVVKQGFDVLGNTVSLAANAYATFTGDNEDAKRALTIFAGVQSTVNTLTALQNALQKQSSLMLGITTLQQKAKTKAMELDTVATEGNIVATKGATAAQWALNLAADANPYVLLLSAIVALVGGYIMFQDEVNKLIGIQEDEQGMSKELQDEYSSLSSKYADTKMKVLNLRDEYKNLKTEAEKQKWIKEHQDDFKQLGVEITSVSDAQNLLIDNTDAFLAAEDAKINAMAYEALAAKKVAEAYELGKEADVYEPAWYETMLAGIKDQWGLIERDIQRGYMKGSAKSWKQLNQQLKGDKYRRIDELNEEINELREKGAAERKKQQELLSGANIKTSTTNTTSNTNKTSNKTSNNTSNNTEETKKETKEVEVKPDLTKMNEELEALKNKRLFAKSQEEIDQLTNEIAQKQKEIEAEEIRLHIKVDPAEEELQNTKKKIEDILSSINVQPEQKLKGNFEGLSDGAKEEANKVLAEYNRIYEARQKLIALINTEGLGEASVDAATEALESLSEQYEDLTEKVTEYNDAASQQKEQQDTQEKMVDGWNNVSNALSTTAGAMKQLGADDAAMTVQFMANAAQMVAQIAKLIPAKQAEAMGNAVAEGTKAPWPVQLATIASLVGTVIATFASLPKFAEGGVITGPFNSGDRMIARVNNGEMILNNRQQSHLFKAIDENKLGGSNNVNVSLTDSAVHGSTMYLTLKNYMKESGKTL